MVNVGGAFANQSLSTLSTTVHFKIGEVLVAILRKNVKKFFQGILKAEY